MVEERRRLSRVRCHLPVRLYPKGEAKVIETLTKDVSLGGLKCLSPSPKTIGTSVIVELDLGPGEMSVDLRGHVAWFQDLPESDQFYLGLIFDEFHERTRQRLSRYLDRIATLIPTLKS